MDADTGRPLVDVILDEAQQKGTGKWTSQNAFDVGAPIPTINAAVESAHHLGAEGGARGREPGAARARRRRLRRRSRSGSSTRRAQALYASKITSYAQGMALLRLASDEYDYDIKPGRHREDLARRLHHPRDVCSATSWRRSSATPDLVNLLLDAAFARRGRRAAGRRGASSCRRRSASASRCSAIERVARLLRRVPQRAAAGQPHAGAARLLRRAHLPAHRSRRACSTRSGETPDDEHRRDR